MEIKDAEVNDLKSLIKIWNDRDRNKKHEASASNTFETSHGIIGQEFDNVGVIIDQCFYYNEDGKLQYSCKSYYHPVKMLFQNIT